MRPPYLFPPHVVGMYESGLQQITHRQRLGLHPQALQHAQVVALLGLQKQQRLAGAAGTSSATHTMHVVHGLAGHMVLHHPGHAGYVKASAGHVGGEKHAALGARGKFSENADARLQSWKFPGKSHLVFINY